MLEQGIEKQFDVAKKNALFKFLFEYCPSPQIIKRFGQLTQLTPPTIY